MEWNLMKTVEPDVVAWSSTNQKTCINKGFSIPSKWIQRVGVLFWKKVGYILNSQLLQQCISVSSQANHDLLSYYIAVIFSFQKAILSSIGTVSPGPSKQTFLLRDMTKASTWFVVWQISRGKCFIENALRSGSLKKTVQPFEVAISP